MKLFDDRLFGTTCHFICFFDTIHWDFRTTPPPPNKATDFAGEIHHNALFLTCLGRHSLLRPKETAGPGTLAGAEVGSVDDTASPSRSAMAGPGAGLGAEGRAGAGGDGAPGGPQVAAQPTAAPAAGRTVAGRRRRLPFPTLHPKHSITTTTPRLAHHATMDFLATQEGREPSFWGVLGDGPQGGRLRCQRHSRPFLALLGSLHRSSVLEPKRPEVLV